MTKKEQLVEIFNHAIQSFSDNIAVAIETKGSKGIEIIVNPRENFTDKLEYYMRAYNDNLVLNTYDGIRIISACAFDRDSNFEDVVNTLEEEF